MLERLAEYRVVRFLLGWPLVYLATGIYVAGIVGYAVQREGAVVALLDRLVAAGTDADGLLAALGTRNGLDPVGPTLADGLAFGDPVAVVLALGIVTFPAVLLVLVRLTRLGPGWKPTYLYVLVALGPLFGVVYGLATTPVLAVELVLFVGAPVVTLGVLVGNAKLRPRIKRLVGS